MRFLPINTENIPVYRLQYSIYAEEKNLKHLFKMLPLLKILPWKLYYSEQPLANVSLKMKYDDFYP
jgi:hypothetical protein